MSRGLKIGLAFVVAPVVLVVPATATPVTRSGTLSFAGLDPSLVVAGRAG
jgi:hypothetical protein